MGIAKLRAFTHLHDGCCIVLLNVRFRIYTADHRVMREEPDIGNFDRITKKISQLYVPRFRRQNNLRLVVSVRIVCLIAGKVNHYVDALF